MSWINKDSYRLIEVKEAKEFAMKNNLQTNGNMYTANFFNKNMLLKIYEERAYLHADYYDLNKYQWCRELDNHSVASGIIPLEDAKKVFESAMKNSNDDILNVKSTARFKYYLKIIDKYMQDFLRGDTDRYDEFLSSLEKEHKCEILNFKKRFLSN